MTEIVDGSVTDHPRAGKAPGRIAGKTDPIEGPHVSSNPVNPGPD